MSATAPAVEWMELAVANTLTISTGQLYCQ